MARAFDDGSSQYLEIDQAVISGPPFTMAAWINGDAFPLAMNTVLWVGDKDSGSDWYLIGVRSNGIVRVQTWDGIGWGQADSTAAATVDTWHHICYVSSASNSHAVYLDGGNKGTNNTNSTPAAPDRTAIGRCADSSPVNYWSGYIAEIGVWSAALIDAEVVSLTRGISPLLVRSASLVAYWPLLRTDQDIVGGYDMTAYSSPTWADHPPKVRYPIYNVGRWIGAAAEPALSIAITPTDSSYWVQGIKIVG